MALLFSKEGAIIEFLAHIKTPIFSLETQYPQAIVLE